MILRIPEQLQSEIDKYFNLQVGRKKVRCPYFINPKLAPGNLRVMSGKGTAEEIELELKIWAKVKKFNLSRASEEDVRQFMQKMKIGIDCSGLIVNAFNGYLKSINKQSLIKYLQFENNSIRDRIGRFLKPVQNISADMITSKLNTKKIKDLNKIRPGDLIRAKGQQKNAHHIGLITEVEFEGDTITRFKYANSHRFYEDQNGMRFGEVVITNPKGELKDQDWKDDLNGRNYFYEDLMVDYEDNGIRRFKFADKIFKVNTAQDE